MRRTYQSFDSITKTTGRACRQCGELFADGAAPGPRDCDECLGLFRGDDNEPEVTGPQRNT